MLETDFPMMLEREDGDIEVVIAATGDVDPADPEVGIFSAGVTDVSVTATDESDKVIKLTEAEENRAIEEATTKLYEVMRNHRQDLDDRSYDDEY